jgi:hypothetical protein
MHNSFKNIKTLLCSYSALYVSGTLAPIIRSLLILHKQPPVTVVVGSVVSSSLGLALVPGQGWKTQQFCNHSTEFLVCVGNMRDTDNTPASNSCIKQTTL